MEVKLEPEMIHNDWDDLSSLKASVKSRKNRTTRACTAITQLVTRPWTVLSQSEAEHAKKVLHERFDLLESVYDRISDLDPSSQNANETAIAEYQEKCKTALDSLAEYISNNTKPVEQEAALPRVATRDSDKFLAPTLLRDKDNPERLRNWIKEFTDFFNSGDLPARNVDIQQAYFLKCLEVPLRQIMRPKIKPGAKIFGPGGCISLLQDVFLTLYPMFSCQVEYFQATQGMDDPMTFIEKLDSLSIDADIGDLDREAITVFKFISGCSDPKLREKLFDLKRKDLTEVKRVISQHVLQLKSEESIRERVQVVAAVNSNNRPSQNSRQPLFRPKTIDDLKGRCWRCGQKRHPDGTQCFALELTCIFCTKQGHLSNVCSRLLMKNHQKPVKSITSDQETQQEVTPRLPVSVSHVNGNFNFDAFPDSGSAATMISEDLTTKHNIPPQPATSNCNYVSVNGSPLVTKGRALLTIKARNTTTKTAAVITPEINNELLIGYSDLKKLQSIPNNFPNATVNAVNTKDESSIFNNMRQSLINEFPSVLTDLLPDSTSMTGNLMKIPITGNEIKPTKIMTARSVPLHWKEKATQAVDKLVKTKVITKVDDRDSLYHSLMALFVLWLISQASTSTSNGQHMSSHQAMTS